MFYRKFIAIAATALLLLFHAIAYAYPPGPAAGGSEAAKAYNKAYSFVLDEKWAEATQAFQNVIKQYPNTAYTDDANFWICFSKQKQNKLQESVGCYETFINHNPKSEWADDAKSNLINVAKSLAKAGMPQYQIHIKKFEEHGTDEVRIHALRALVDSGDATPDDVIAIYNAEKNPKNRSNIVYILTDLESPDVTIKLGDIAIKDPDVSVRKNAVHALGDRGGKESVGALKKILESKTDLEVRKAALYALGETEDPAIVMTLAEVARNEANVELAKASVYALADMDSKPAIDALQSILAQVKPTEIRKAVIFALADHNAITGPMLLNVAINDPDAELRRNAVYALAELDGTDRFQSLREVFSKSKELEVRKAALYAIMDRPDERAKTFLVDIAINDPNEELAKAAVYSLGDNLKEQDMPVLLDLVQKAKNLEVRKAALYKAIDMGGDNAVKVLGQYLKQGSDPELRITAVRALGDSDSDEAVPVLLNLAKNDPDKQIRMAAVQSLGQIGTPKAKQALRTIITGNSNFTHAKIERGSSNR